MEELKTRLATEGSITFSVRARPGASSTRFKSIMADGSLKIDIAAVPEDGEANEELCRFLSEEFGVNIHQISVLSGATARIKLIKISR